MTHRTPTPDDAYLMLLGRAAYTWAYTEWSLLYIIKWATGEDLSHLVGGTGGRIVRRFESVVDDLEAPDNLRDGARESARRLLALNDRRNDLLHARPATTPDTEEQRLNRWAPGNDAATPGFIEHTDIERFITELEDVEDLIDPLHEWLYQRDQQSAETLRP